MSPIRKTAAFVLLGAIGIAPARDVRAQVAVHPGALRKPAVQTEAKVGEKIHLPQLGAGKYSAEMIVHVPVFGDGTGDMIVENNLMRYHASFRGGAVSETDWINFTTGFSVQKQHFFIDKKPTLNQAFIAKLSNVVATKLPDTVYRGLPVKAYRIDDEKITDTRAFRGIVYIYADSVPVLVLGKERRIDDYPKCKGTYEDIKMDAIVVHMNEEQDLEALKPPTRTELAKRAPPQSTTCAP